MSAHQSEPLLSTRTRLTRLALPCQVITKTPSRPPTLWTPTHSKTPRQPKRRAMPHGWRRSGSGSSTLSGESASSSKNPRTSANTAATTGLPVSPLHHAAAAVAEPCSCRRAVFPLIFHSIPEEIPQASQPLITRLYQLWLVLAGTLVVNMVACICILASGSSNGGSDLGSSIGCVYASCC